MENKFEELISDMPGTLSNRIAGYAQNQSIQKALIALFLLSITTVFFNKVFTSDYGIHLSIGKHFIETGKVPHEEFLVYPLLDQTMNYEELGFQAMLYLVYRLVGTEGVSVFVWLIAALSFLFIYLSLRAREIHPWIALFTLLLFAMPFRIRLQPRPEIIAYFFCAFLMYGCSLFYYRGNRRILYTFPLVFLVWANIHPSTLAGFATVGAYGTQSFVIWYRDKFSRQSFRDHLLIPLGILAVSFLATFLSKHGFQSVLTPLKLIANPDQMTGISEMTSIKFSGFYEFYKYILALCVSSAVLGILVFRIKIHDLILAAYGLKLPLQVARGLAFMAIFSIPLVAQAFDGIRKRILEELEKRDALRGKKAEEGSEERKHPGKKKRRKPVPQDGPAKGPSPPPELLSGRRLRAAVVLVWLVFLSVTGYGAYFIRTGTRNIVENGIGLTEHKFSLLSGEFLRNLDIQGNMFNFFDLGGFLEWQLFPGKRVFIDGRAGTPALFQEHQAVTSAIGDIEGIFRRYGITYIVTKTVDSSGIVLPLVNYLGVNPGWELVFADGLTVVFVKNIPENRPIIERYRLPKNLLANQIINELIHYTYIGVNKGLAYSWIGNIYMQSQDYANAGKYFRMAYEETGDRNMAAMAKRLEGMGGPR